MAQQDKNNHTLNVSLGIVGSRYFDNYSQFSLMVSSWIDKLPPSTQIARIVSGDAKGADALAERFAREHKIMFHKHVADWNKYGKAAGPLRNQLIVGQCTHLIAFVGTKSIGTKSTIKFAKTKGIPITQFSCSCE